MPTFTFSAYVPYIAGSYDREAYIYGDYTCDKDGENIQLGKYVTDTDLNDEIEDRLYDMLAEQVDEDLAEWRADRDDAKGEYLYDLACERAMENAL